MKEKAVYSNDLQEYQNNCEKAFQDLERLHQKNNKTHYWALCNSLIKSKTYKHVFLDVRHVSTVFKHDIMVLIIILDKENTLSVVSNIELNYAKKLSIIKMLNGKGLLIRRYLYGLELNEVQLGKNYNMEQQSRDLQHQGKKIIQIDQSSDKCPVMTIMSGPYFKICNHFNWDYDGITIIPMMPEFPPSTQNNGIQENFSQKPNMLPSSRLA